MKRIYILAFFLAGCIAIKPTERINFTAPEFYPEGIAYDKGSDVFYVSSVRKGIIGKVTRKGNYSAFVNDTTLQSSYGIKISPDGKRLLVCNGDARYSRYSTPDTFRKKARLLSFNLSTGRREQDVDLSRLIPGKHFPNDLAFDKDGNAYVTDSYAHAIYKVTPDGQASIFSQSKLFVTEGIGINGIVFHPDGFLLVDNSNTGCLYKVPLSNASTVTKVKVEQYFLGADGMILNDNNSITMVVNGGNDKIFKLTSKDGWVTAKLAATTLIADRFTYPTTATADAEAIWVSNGKFSDLNDSTAFPAKIFAIQKVVLKPVP